ncbi:hypothetical protein Q4Q35_11300 [Flavivirga aquimarina]|uniref:SMODS-associating 2TM beta-strand rich effector domain-containing protein n=1 Tax=Flavivirga aquimarina TaxID=2027862 RepID=A0ABT8WBG9_9FLAO|nr:hypothetical protein [Flavivirga aquimarina]MDO5970391.1 hypothetical protein [Flavivirga aquimarina]
MNKRDIIITIIGFIVSLTTVIITTLNSDFDSLIKASLLTLALLSSIIWLVNNIGLSIDSERIKKTLRIIAYSSTTSFFVVNETMSKIGGYGSKVYGSKSTTQKIHSRGQKLLVSFFDANEKTIGHLCLNEEESILLSINFNRNKKKIFLLNRIDSWNSRVERIDLITSFFYSNFEGYNDSHNKTKTIIPLNDNSQQIGKEIIFNEIDFDNIFDKPPLLRDSLIVEKLTSGIR